MKTVLLVLGTIALAVVLIGAGLFAGATLFRDTWTSRVAASGLMGPDMMFGQWNDTSCAGGYEGRAQAGTAWGAMPCDGGYAIPEAEGDEITLEDAAAAVERYVERLGYNGLHLTEVMEFDQNFYAIVAEDDTDIGAMELLVDKVGGDVGPEPGPNMMWNAKYGMHRGGMMGMMRGSVTGEMRLSPQDAEAVAQSWLDANLPGRTAGDADSFYGYYTLHYLRDGEVEGMLSVHGGSGDVWHHGWHGSFIAMVGDHEEDVP
jgi:hypothetical protein